MNKLVEDLLTLIRLEKLEENLYRGESRATGQRSVFGGLVAGQALMAASRTVPEDRLVHSLHAYFLRPGDFTRPILYDVDRIRDGRSFTTRRVNAIQHGRAIFSLAASFQGAEQGVEHQNPMPEVPDPESLPEEAQQRRAFATRIPEPYREAFVRERPVDVRPVKPANPYEFEAQSPRRMSWFRIPGPLDTDPLTDRALLAFCSDFGLMGTAMLPHGLSFFSPSVQSASLDHAMWFYQPFRMDDWLLYVTESPVAAGARGFNHGRIYRRDGVLVATVAQEGLMRVREGGDG